MELNFAEAFTSFIDDQDQLKKEKRAQESHDLRMERDRIALERDQRKQAEEIAAHKKKVDDMVINRSYEFMKTLQGTEHMAASGEQLKPLAEFAKEKGGSMDIIGFRKLKNSDSYMATLVNDPDTGQQIEVFVPTFAKDGVTAQKFMLTKEDEEFIPLFDMSKTDEEVYRGEQFQHLLNSKDPAKRKIAKNIVESRRWIKKETGLESAGTDSSKALGALSTNLNKVQSSLVSAIKQSDDTIKATLEEYDNGLTDPTMDTLKKDLQKSLDIVNDKGVWISHSDEVKKQAQAEADQIQASLDKIDEAKESKTSFQAELDTIAKAQTKIGKLLMSGKGLSGSGKHDPDSQIMNVTLSRLRGVDFPDQKEVEPLDDLLATDPNRTSGDEGTGGGGDGPVQKPNLKPGAKPNPNRTANRLNTQTGVASRLEKARTEGAGDLSLTEKIGKTKDKAMEKVGETVREVSKEVGIVKDAVVDILTTDFLGNNKRNYKSMAELAGSTSYTKPTGKTGGIHKQVREEKARREAIMAGDESMKKSYENTDNILNAVHNRMLRDTVGKGALTRRKAGDADWLPSGKQRAALQDAIDTNAKLPDDEKFLTPSMVEAAQAIISDPESAVRRVRQAWGLEKPPAPPLRQWKSQGASDSEWMGPKAKAKAIKQIEEEYGKEAAEKYKEAFEEAEKKLANLPVLGIQSLNKRKTGANDETVPFGPGKALEIEVFPNTKAPTTTRRQRQNRG